MKRIQKKNINTPAFYDKVWENEVNLRPYYDAVRQRALIKHVKNGDAVLDVGAGVYGSCQFIAETTKIKARLNCIDFSSKAKEIVTKAHPGIQFTVSKSDVLTYPNRSFTCVIAGEIIEHINDPGLFAKELCRVTKPGGMVSLSTVNTKCENAKRHGVYKDHIWEFTPEDLIRLFEPYGETVYEVVGDYHFIYCRVPGIITLTADDFHETNHKLELLERIHNETGALFNLFTISGLCSRGFIEKVKQIKWIDMIAHGWKHPHARECERWEYDQSKRYLNYIEEFNFTKGFKAPGWQISDGMYKALVESGYWVADQHYNDKRRPVELKAHYPDAKSHFHIGHMGGFNPNEIEDNLNAAIALRGEFGFIKDIF